MKTTMGLLVVFVFVLTGCLQTRQQIRGAVGDGGSDVGSIEAPPASIPQGNTQKQKALIDSRFFEIDRDFRELYGKIEAMEGRIEQMSVDGGRGSMNPENNEKIKSLESRMSTLEEAILSIDKKLSKMKTSGIPSKGKGMPSGAFQQGEYHFANNDCVNAIESFDKYRKKYPKGRYYSNATFNMGECFRKLDLSKDASAFYQEVVTRFPKTKVAKRAQSRLSKVQ